MGTPDFAIPSLEVLHSNGYEVVGVVTAPDKPAGRGKKLQSAPVKLAAEQLGLTVLQPTNLKDPGFQQTLAALEPDLGVIVAFRMLPEAVWSMPRLGSINLHGSLLPNYRGAAPINWAIINGEKETGITTFFLKHEIDTGDLLLQETMPIGPDETAGELHDRMMELGATLVLKTVQQIENETAAPLPQTQSGDVKAAPKIQKETARIDWTKPASEIHNLVRGMSPYPGAWTTADGLQLKVLSGKPATGSLGPGVVQSDSDNIVVGTGDGTYQLLELQLEGKRRMSVQEFIRGHSIKSVG